MGRYRVRPNEGVNDDENGFIDMIRTLNDGLGK